MTSRDPNQMALLLADFVNEWMPGTARARGRRGMKDLERIAARRWRRAVKRNGSDAQFTLRLTATSEKAPKPGRP